MDEPEYEVEVTVPQSRDDVRFDEAGTRSLVGQRAPLRLNAFGDWSQLPACVCEVRAATLADDGAIGLVLLVSESVKARVPKRPNASIGFRLAAIIDEVGSEGPRPTTRAHDVVLLEVGILPDPAAVLGG